MVPGVDLGFWKEVELDLRLILTASDCQEKETEIHRSILGSSSSWKENPCGVLVGKYVVSDLYCAQGGL